MDKQQFIDEVRPELKQLGFRKNGMYWYKRCDGFTCCINLQTSNWDSNDYYINVGLSLDDSPSCRPTLLKWYCRHRLKGNLGGRNPSPDELLEHLNLIQDRIKTKKDIRNFLISQKAKEVVGNQFWY